MYFQWQIRLRIGFPLLFLFFIFRVNAAEISGFVKDSLSHQGISDVIITVSGSSSVAFSDATGHFRLNIPEGKVVLQYNHTGFRTLVDSALASDQHGNPINIFLVAVPVHLSEAVITNQKNTGESVSVITQLDMSLRPVNSAQDLYRMVPGLFIAQHAGGGKAEQIFLRGFDADHGTDFAVNLDGMPVNMVSHAHGQGYADFHFVIPETIDRLVVSKGPYEASAGDFATAGSGNFFTKNMISKNEVKIEGGEFDTYRTLLMMKFADKKNFFRNKNDYGYFAGEYYFSNSYFESKQHFNRYNFFGKYSIELNERNFLSVTGSAFNSYWDASGQIPGRAVNDHLISRFGSLDNSEGGATSRTNANALLTSAVKNGGLFKNQFYYSYYLFNLYSDFTFFLNDSMHGDQINQREHGRNIYGYKTSFEKFHSSGKLELKTEVAAGTRIDRGENSLYHTELREFLNTIADGKLTEENFYAYANETMKLNEKFSVNGGLRADYFVFEYQNFVDNNLSGQKAKHILSPKLNFYYTPNSSLEFYVRAGTGFHSNDIRSVISGIAGNNLPRATGSEAGSTFKIGKNILVNAAMWWLGLENELVYSGDDGEVEITGATRRFGSDVSLRWEIFQSFFADADLNFSHGRYTNLPQGKNFIPLAPDFTSTGGFTYKKENGFSGSIRYRYIDARPADEENTIRAKGYFIMDLIVSYSVKNFQFGISVQNLLNTKWNEAQFATESRLQNEPYPVTELHFTPGTPFFLKGSITCFF